jgi:hypothetical protein
MGCALIRVANALIAAYRRLSHINSTNNNQQRMTESISFRLEDDVLDQLRDLANQRKMSLNSLVSQILDNYLKMGIYDKAFGFFAMGKDALRLALAKLNDDEIQAIADAGTGIHRHIVLYLFGRVTKQTMLSYMDIYGNRFDSFKHFKSDSKHILTIYHGINLQFSKLYYNITKMILELGGISTIESERDISADGFSISFDLSS